MSNTNDERSSETALGLGTPRRTFLVRAGLTAGSLVVSNTLLSSVAHALPENLQTDHQHGSAGRPL